MGKNFSRNMSYRGLKVITPQVFGDARGYFMETYNYNDYKEAGIDQVFVQDKPVRIQKRRSAGASFPDQLPPGQTGESDSRRSV